MKKKLEKDKMKPEGENRILFFKIAQWSGISESQIRETD